MIILSTIIIIITFIYSICKKNFLNPMALFNFTIIGSYLGYEIYLKKRYGEVEYESILAYIYVIVFFNFFYLITSFILRNIKIVKIKKKIKIPFNFLRIVLIFSIFVTLINLFKVFKVLDFSNPSKIFLLLRAYIVIGKVKLFFGHFWIISHLTCLVGFFKWRRKKEYWLCVILYFINVFILRMSRDGLLLISLSFCIWIYFYNKYILKKKVKIILFILFALFFIVIFSIVALITGKANSGIFESFIKYFSYQIIAFNERVLNAGIYEPGAIILGPFKYLLNEFGIIDLNNLKKILSMEKYNVYGPIGLPYVDSKLYGIILAYSWWGIFFGFLFRGIENGNINFILLYSIMSTPLITTFFDYKLHDILWIYYLLAIICINLIFYKREKYEN